MTPAVTKRTSRTFNGEPTPVAEKADNLDNRWIVKERSIDESRPLRVVIIGAGISGIMACIRFVQRIPNLELCIYDKNADVGGTWFENRYPGCACDIPAHTYQATFEPNKEWSQFYASAPEIHRYWKRVALKYGCLKYMKLKQKVSEAIWDDGLSKWCLKVQDGQRVAVIGNGSSGIQIVPAVLPDVTHIDHYVRSRTWISPSFARDQIDRRGKKLDNISFTPEELESFKKDHQVYQKFRKEVELQLQSIHGATLTGSEMQVEGQQVFAENMKARLANKPELFDELLPSFPPACRRLTPGPGYLEALTDPKVDLIKSEIVKVDETGIVTADGQHRPVDMLVCATGFDTSSTPRFPIIGSGGVSLAEKWKDTPENYLSVTTDGFPNFFICLGPNSGLGEGNLLLLIEKSIDYFTECMQKMQRDNIRSMTVRRDAVRRFTKYCDQYFSLTVFSSKCRSWYKGGTEEGRIVALWPGSSLHAMKAFANPRWEDFEYEYVDDNPTGWLGDGWTENEKYNRINVDYLDDDQIDFPRRRRTLHSLSR
ncbi:hypothetical protein N7474_002497 [Penicillium riverlandense]|uniref:uncharacterized protein n=1 Tax=Penicillium riverlandense TaxID=1903569 RepID=UPI002546F083|nr:uncharacterized protein N7474_002497 [Penicillium riverlandense]KAJ5825359.1 hypothetical protein N7474_002497 [Penicillium riverlandense]